MKANELNLSPFLPPSLLSPALAAVQKAKFQGSKAKENIQDGPSGFCPLVIPDMLLPQLAWHLENACKMRIRS